MISRQEYEDAELLMALHEELQQDLGDYCFTDDEIMWPFGELYYVVVFPPSPQIAHAPGDEALAKMQRQRYQRMVRSAMVLSASEYLMRISAKSVLRPAAAEINAARGFWRQRYPPKWQC